MTRLLGEPLSGGAVCVVAHDSDDFVARLRRNRPGPDAEINALENPYAREAFAYLAHLQDRLSATGPAFVLVDISLVIRSTGIR